MTIQEKIRNLELTIQQNCTKINKAQGRISLLAATKYSDPGTINTAIDAGIKIIGENRIQDARTKFPLLKPVRKHFIGHLQQNKVKTAVELFDCIESVDSLAIAQKINEAAQKQGKIMTVYLEINIAADNKKFGIPAEKTLQLVRQVNQLQSLQLKGLMTIVPFFKNTEETRPYFREMKGIFDLCKTECPTLEVLSMGMSHDYAIAIEEGSTEIRIGSLLFDTPV